MQSSPYINRFLQPDTIIPGAANPQSWNRFSYVLNSPIQYSDPSGYRPYGPYDPYRASKSWAIFLTVNLATSGIPENYWGGNDYPAPAQVNYEASALLPAGHWNLCGDISLSMILETATGRMDMLSDIYAESSSDRGWNRPTSAYKVAQQLAASFPGGWRARSVIYGEVATFAAGDVDPASYVSNSPYGSSNILSADTLVNRLAHMLAVGHYVIVGVTQLKSDASGRIPGLVNNGADNSCGHWVVVTGVTDSHVYINNPFTNRREHYTWKEFYSSWRHDWIEIIPPPKYLRNKTETQ